MYKHVHVCAYVLVLNAGFHGLCHAFADVGTPLPSLLLTADALRNSAYSIEDYFIKLQDLWIREILRELLMEM